MINEEKEKEIVSLLEEQKNSKLFLEVTGYISRLDAYIYKLEKQLKQRDEVIDEAISYCDEYKNYLDYKYMTNLYNTHLLNKVLGDDD